MGDDAVRRFAAVALLLVVVGACRPASAQIFRYMAFGDSITEADPLFDNSNPYLGGYPGRLETMLGCTPTTCEVVNRGKGGERTAAGLTRIDTLLNTEGPWDIVMLLEGTNDIYKLNPIPNATIEFNLDNMANKAAAHGADAVHASIPWFHPSGNRGTTRDDEVEDLRNLLVSLAAARNRYFVDVWSILCPLGPDQHGHTHQQCFNHHYFSGVPDPDPVGHPNATGFDMMADLFFTRIISVPVPGLPVPIAPMGVVNVPNPIFSWDKESPDRATWYQLQVFGPGGTLYDEWHMEASFCGTTTCTVNALLNLAPGNEYTWQVRGRNPLGRGPWAGGSFIYDPDLIFMDGFESGDTTTWDGGGPGS